MAYDDLASDLCYRARLAFNRLELFRDLYQRAYRLGYPERDNWYTTTPGERKHRDIYDSNFSDSWGRLANGLYTGMCPPWSPWFHLLPGSEVPEEQEDQVLDLLQPHAKSMWQALSQSNFYTELYPCMMDLIAGTGHILTDDHPRRGLVFRCVPIYEVALESDSFGVCARFWRRKIRARHFPKEFPNITLPSELADQIENRPDSDIEILTATVESEKPLHEAVQYIIYEKTKRILDERHFFEQPWSSPRWSVLSGEDYGRGPALKAEPTAYSTNEAAKLMLMAANISLFGMWLVDSERIVEGTVQLGSGAMIPVKPNGQDVAQAMRPLVPSTNFDLGSFAIEDLRSQVKRNLYRDNLASVERPGMTATEVLERQALVAQDMGAAYGRLTSELLQPVLKRVSGILARRGLMPPEIKIDGKVVGVQYTSALARAQQYEEVVGMRAFIQDVGMLTQIDPSAKYALNTGAYARKMAGLTGVDLDVTRTQEEIQALAEQEAAGQAELMQHQQDAEMQMQQAKQGAEPAPAAGPGAPAPQAGISGA
jgi:hypothetical protein